MTVNREAFEQIVEDQLNICRKMLVLKGNEYATDDQLHNFKTSAALQGNRPVDALAGMMAKHTVSIYDMIGSEGSYTLDVWVEKITDHINYLILLKAIIIESHEKVVTSLEEERGDVDDHVDSSSDGLYAYFAKDENGVWTFVAANCSSEEVISHDKNYTAKNGYVRTKLVTLD